MGKDNSYYIALHNKPAVVVAAAVVAFVVDHILDDRIS